MEAGTLHFYERAKAITHTEFFDAQATFNRIRRGVGPFFEKYDVWVTPTMAQVAPRHGIYGMNVDLEPAEFLAHEQRPAQFMVLYNVTASPRCRSRSACTRAACPSACRWRRATRASTCSSGSARRWEEAMSWRDRLPPLHVSKLGSG